MGQTPAGGRKGEKHPERYAYAYGAITFLLNQPEQLDLPACEGCFRGAQQPGEQIVLLVIGSGLKDKVLFRVLADRMS